MTFLELVQRLHSEAGRQGTAPSTVAGQTGMNQRLVNWILAAYEDVQSERETWLFRQADFSFSTIATISNYTKAAVSLDDLASWVINPDQSYLSGIKLYSSVSDEQHLIYCPWVDFNKEYKLGALRAMTGRPSVFSIKPDQSIELWPIPNDVFTVSGEYRKNLQTLTNNTDEPILPDYHVIIVWKALMYYGAFEGAPEVYAHGENQYNKLLSKLEMNQLPGIGWGPPLA